MTLVSVNFCGGEVLSIYRQVVILRNFTLIVESNLEKRWFCFTSPCGKPQNSRYPLNQSDASKRISVTRLLPRFRQFEFSLPPCDGILFFDWLL